QEEMAEYVGAERALDLRRLYGGEIRIVMLFGGVVHQDIQRAELFDHVLNRPVAKGLVGNVALDQKMVAAFCRDQSCGFGRVGVFGPEDDREISPFLRESHGNGAANSAVPAGNESNLALELARSLVASGLTLGAGAHLRLIAGLLFLVLGWKSLVLAGHLR